MKSNFLNIIISFLGIITAISCVQQKEFDTPQIKCDEPSITANTTIDKVKQLATNKLTQITEDLVVEGYVISNDEAGNFYRTLHFQDKLDNPTQGLQIDVDLQDMYTIFQTGRKVYVKLKGLYIQNLKGTIKLGGTYEKYGKISIGRLSAEQSKKVLFRSCDEPQKIRPKTVTIDNISDQLINTLIKLENIEVHPENLCQNYAEEGKNTNVKLQDCEGKTILLRNSGYAQFQNQKLPLGKGSIVAVLGKYGDDYQLTIRNIDDVKMDGSRCDGADFSCEIPKANANLQQIKNIYKHEKVQITENLIFDATITANDKSSNFYKLIYIQDETGGIKVKINQTDLYARGYNVGQKITISTQNLYIDSVKGELTLGGLYKNNVGGIEKSAIYRHLYPHDENKPIEPEIINKFSDESIGKLVQIEKMQFVQIDEPFAVLSSKKDKIKVKTKDLISCDGKTTIKVATSTYADFSKKITPKGNGTVVGIMSKYNDTYQLWLRSKDDYSKMIGERCNIKKEAVLKSVSDIRALFNGTSTTISEDFKIKVVVTSNRNSKNTDDKNAFVQDNSSGIALRFKESHNLNLGDEVEFFLKGTKLDKYKGLLQLSLTNSSIQNKKAGTLPTPKNITIKQAISGDYESQLVQIENVQFKDISKNYKGNNVITDCVNELQMYVRSQSTFANEKVSSKNGVIKGIMSVYNTPQFYVRDVQDILFGSDYKKCEDSNPPTDTGNNDVAIATELYFSEYSEGSSNNKYIEVYNGTGSEVDLSDYSIRLYTNGGTAPKNKLTFDAGTKLADKSVYVIYNSKADEVIKSKGNKSSTVTYFNGNDAIELLKANVVIDAIGKVGENPGKGWSVAGIVNATYDRTLIRKNNVTKGNVDWKKSAGTDTENSEWIVKNKDDWTSVGIR